MSDYSGRERVAYDQGFRDGAATALHEWSAEIADLKSRLESRLADVGAWLRSYEQEHAALRLAARAVAEAEAGYAGLLAERDDGDQLPTLGETWGKLRLALADPLISAAAKEEKP